MSWWSETKRLTNWREFWQTLALAILVWSIFALGIWARNVTIERNMDAANGVPTPTAVPWEPWK